MKSHSHPPLPQDTHKSGCPEITKNSRHRQNTSRSAKPASREKTIKKKITKSIRKIPAKVCLTLDTVLIPALKRMLQCKTDQSYPVRDKKTTHIKKFERFKTYEQFLIYSLFSPSLTSPYSKNAEYILAFMDSGTEQRKKNHRRHKPNDKISVIMLPSQIDSGFLNAVFCVLQQTYQNLELLIPCSGYQVVADLLPEHRKEIIRIIEVDGCKNSAEIIQKTVEAASGEYLCYIDRHCTMAPDWLLILAEELTTHREFEIAYCALKITGNGSSYDERIQFAAYNRPAHEYSNLLHYSAIMHRRSLLLHKGGIKDSSVHQAFWEMLLRYTESKAPLAVPALLVSRTEETELAHCKKTEPSLVDNYLAADPIKNHLQGNHLQDIGRMYSPLFIPDIGKQRKTSIIIPSFEAWPFLRSCVESVLAFSPQGAYELIIVDNASGESVQRYLNELMNSGRSKVIFNQRNLGFTYAVNQGIMAASEENDIVLLNNDAVVTRGWLEAMWAVLEEHKDAGLIAPRQVMLPGASKTWTHQPLRTDDRECDVNISAVHANVINPRFNQLKGYIELSFAPFFCIYIPRHTLNETGLLDVENGPHYISDRLYCDLVRTMSDRKIIYTPFSKVYHFHQQATKELKEKNPSLYEKMFVRNSWKEIK